MSVGLLLALAVVAVAPAARAASCSPTAHAPILITKNSDFNAANGVASGTGTASDPFLLANLQFSQMPGGYGLKVDNSKGTVTAYFAVTCVQSNFTLSAPSGSTLVWIVNVHQATTISLVSANAGEAGGSVGIRLDGSSAITLDNESINKFGSDGVQVNNSDHITILDSKLKAFRNGLSLLNSHDITVGQPCTLTSGNGCNEFTYDDDRGILIENSYAIAVTGTITNADDSGGILIDGSNSFNIFLTDGKATANGPICPSGSPTGIVSDTIAGISVANGAHDITVRGYTINANGDGAGGFFDIMNGGNGLYMDPCTLVVTALKRATPPGGANLDFNDNCYHFEFNFNPVPTSSC